MGVSGTDYCAVNPNAGNTVNQPRPTPNVPRPPTPNPTPQRPAPTLQPFIDDNEDFNEDVLDNMNIDTSKILMDRQGGCSKDSQCGECVGVSLLVL